MLFIPNRLRIVNTKTQVFIVQGGFRLYFYAMKHLFTACGICIVILAQGQQLLNSGFENWTLKNEYIEPDGWISTNAYAFFGAPETCYPFEDAHSGNWSAKLETRLDPITGDTLRAVLITGGDYEAPGTSYPHRPAACSFYYKHNRLDTAAAVVYLTKWNPVLKRKDTLASGFTIFFDIATNFTLRTIPLTYVGNVKPDTCLFLFTTTLKEKPNPGNYLIIDDIAFTGFLNVDGVEIQPALNIYPNPVKDVVTIDAEDEIKQVTIRTMEGRDVFKGVDKKLIISHLKSSVYFIEVETDNGRIYTQRLVKE